MMTVRAIRTFTGSRGKVNENQIIVVSNSVGESLIRQGLAEMYSSSKLLQDKMKRPENQPSVTTKIASISENAPRGFRQVGLPISNEEMPAMKQVEEQRESNDNDKPI